MELSKYSINDVLFFCKYLNVLVIDNQENIDREFIDILDDLFLYVTYIEKNCLIEFNISSRFDLAIINIDKDEHCLILKKIKKASQSIPILAMSIFENPTLMLSTVKIGVLGYLLDPIHYNQLKQQLVKTREDKQSEINDKLGKVGETRSKEADNHVKRVAHYSKELALLYGLEKKEAEILFAASPMHDIGKIGIPSHILKKSGKLTTTEFEIMKTHTKVGYNILKDSSIYRLKAAALISLTHHEKYDGTGYPNGLSGFEIHIYGRITAIADVFDALGSDRMYKKAWEDEKILELLTKEKGKHFDPILIELFLENINIFLEIRDKYKT